MNTKNLLLGILVLLAITFASSTVYEYNQGNSLSAQIQSETAATQCIRTGQGYAFDVRVVADGTPISGARVNAISYTVCASGYTEWGNPITTVTPRNGTVALPVSGIDGYSIIVNDQGSNYFVGEVSIAPVQVTTVTLTIPSGNVTVTKCNPRALCHL